MVNDNLMLEGMAFDMRNFLKRKKEMLIGADDFIALMDEIVDVVPTIRKKKIDDVFLHRYYLFSIEDGADLDDYLYTMGKVISSFGEMLRLENPSESVPFINIRIPPQKQKERLYADAAAGFAETIRKSAYVICLDISEWLSELQNPDFKRFLIYIEKLYFKAIVVFRIPYLDKETVDQVYSALSDVLTVTKVMFHPLSLEQLSEFGKLRLKSFGYEAAPEVWDLFRERIIQEKNEGKFYEKMTADKLVRELVYKKQLALAASGSAKDDHMIVPEDIGDFVGDYQAEMTIDEMMDGLVGLKEIKEQIKEIVQTIAFIKKNPSFDNPCIHMRFVGNPGTGKTTVARIIGRLLKENGVLSKGDFFEKTGRELCGVYVGQTAPLTSRICRDAYGSVLFIDEAYSLYGSGISENDFGREALVTLMGEMENHRNDFVVIMAGYSDEMADLMTGNPGLLSRMPYYMEFPNYTKEELSEIFFSMIPDDVEFTEEFKSSVTDYFLGLGEDILSQKEFSNARFVRNLFEQTLSKAILRKSNEEAERLILLPQDFEMARSSKSISQLIGERHRQIGFVQ